MTEAIAIAPQIHQASICTCGESSNVAASLAQSVTKKANRIGAAIIAICILSHKTKTLARDLFFDRLPLGAPKMKIAQDKIRLNIAGATSSISSASGIDLEYGISSTAADH